MSFLRSRRYCHGQLHPVTLLTPPQHPEAWPFQEPVDEQQVPDYYDIIHDPVDLSLIEKRLNLGDYYMTLDIFVADFRRMFDNCRNYNKSETPYYKCSDRLQAAFDQTMFGRLTAKKPEQ